MLQMRAEKQEPDRERVSIKWRFRHDFRVVERPDRQADEDIFSALDDRKESTEIKPASPFRISR